MKIAFITGGSGFIGANLIFRLLEKKYIVHILSRKLTDRWRLTEIEKRIYVHNESLLEEKKLATLLKKIRPTIIIHLAAFGGRESESDMQEILQTNIVGFGNLLTASRDIPYRQFINTGSSSEYGFSNKPMREIDALSPNSFYAVSKASATYLTSVFSKQYKKPIMTIRPFSVYGPYESRGRFIPTVIHAARHNIPIHVTSGDVRRDFIYIDDLVDLYMLALEKGHLFPGEVFNGGTGVEHTNDDIVAMIGTIAKSQLVVKKGMFPNRGWDATHWRGDPLYSQKKLGWKPETRLITGLKKTYEWFLKNKTFDRYYV